MSSLGGSISGKLAWITAWGFDHFEILSMNELKELSHSLGGGIKYTLSNDNQRYIIYMHIYVYMNIHKHIQIYTYTCIIKHTLSNDATQSWSSTS